MILPAITAKLYQDIVNAMISTPMDSPERQRLSRIQRQLANAQQTMSADKEVLTAWVKAG